MLRPERRGVPEVLGILRRWENVVKWENDMMWYNGVKW
jgi:hypothetical protein